MSTIYKPEAKLTIESDAIWTDREVLIDQDKDGFFNIKGGTFTPVQADCIAAFITAKKELKCLKS